MEAKSDSIQQEGSLAIALQFHSTVLDYLEHDFQTRRWHRLDQLAHTVGLPPHYVETVLKRLWKYGRVCFRTDRGQRVWRYSPLGYKVSSLP